MKALHWLQFFQAQREQYGKRVFTVTELANVARTSRGALNVEMSRLLRRGLITRYAQGRYGPVETVSPEDVLPSIDPSAYITGFYALHRHNLVTQVPSEITCFTARRHNRSRERQSPLGKLVFVCASPRIYARPGKGVIAGPEQALCDFIHLSRYRSLEAQAMVTFRNLGSLKIQRLNRILLRYSQTVSQAVRRILLSEQPGS